jgi:uncharacterized protein (DUF488 family)
VPTVRTIGHGTASQEELSARLSRAGVQHLIDIRTAPGSRKHPHAARAALEQWLPAAGITYRWEQRLGGFRRPPPDSPDVVWRNESFRGYAAHLRTEIASAALAEVLAEIEGRSVALMCSETLWWRCHRRLVADVLVCVHGCEVRHIMPSGEAAHRPTPGARRVGDVLVYDGSAT